jgi:hypothetical protein
MAYSFPYDEKNVFPDYFFAFGDFWSDSVELPLPEEKVYSVGYPYLESKFDEHDDIEQNEQVVFISQLDIGEELSRFAVELSETEGYDVDIIYKLHPKEYDSWEQDYPWLSESDIVCVTEETPLYKLFAESTAQIGVYSTALYEGLRFGLQTYILELPGSKSMQSLIENDYAELIRTVNEYVNCRNEGKEMNEMRDVRCFFNDNPMDGFESAIKDIRQSDERI